jgi:hypothetical protein
MTVLLKLLLVCCALLFGYVLRGVIDKWREPRKNEAVQPSRDESSLDELLLAAAPEPFGHAHCRAALASFVAAVRYVRERLDTTGYSMGQLDARALAWVLESLTPLTEAISGSPRWGSERLRRHLQQMDVTLGPGSWWSASQRPVESTILTRSRLVQVPLLEAAYDAVYYEQAAKKCARKRSRAWVIGEAPAVAIGRGQQQLARPEVDA